VRVFSLSCTFIPTNIPSGNLLIRPAPQISRSPYNFEIVLLDHGLYFDLETRLRINYSKLWLSLIATNSPSVNADRRKYQISFCNIILGRAALKGTWEDDPLSSESKSGSTFKRASSMIDMMPQSDEEMEAIRNAVVNREGLLLSVFDVLRRVPRRVLMVLKLNDLTRLVVLLLDRLRRA